MRATWHLGGALLASANVAQISSYTARHIPPFQFLTRGDPLSGDDVRALSALASKRRRFTFRGGVDICHEKVRFWWNRIGPLFAADVRRQQVSRMKGFRQWKWHLDEVYVEINGEMHYLWRAVDQEGELLESYVTKSRG